MAKTSKYATKPMDLPINLQGDDLFTHLLCIGPTRSGKTATILKPLIYQLLLAKKRGVQLGISVVEPKGDLAWMVREMAEEMGLDYMHIDPFVEDSNKFNPMEGDADDVVEATNVALKGLFGQQEAFFETVQELALKNVIYLLKQLFGDDFDLQTVLQTLRDLDLMTQYVEDLKNKLINQGENPEHNETIKFFEEEMVGDMSEHYRKLILGLRAQLENLTSNHNLNDVLMGKGDLDPDEHLAKGGILSVNTNLGKLRKSGDAFGQLMIMNLQNATFRREGTEKTRIPHFLIVDEYSRYMNPDVEIFLSLAAEYRVSGILAAQSLGQLEVSTGEISGEVMKRTIMTSCRNKITFGGLSYLDAQEFSEEFGMDRVIMRQSTYENRIMYPRLFPNSYRDTEQEEYRFSYTDIMDGLPRFHFIHKLMENGSQQQPGIAKGQFIPRNWKELREWEDNAKPFDETEADVVEKRGILVSLKQLQENTKRLTPRKVRRNMPQLKNIDDNTILDLMGGIEDKESKDEVRKMPKNEVRYVWSDKESDNPYDDMEEDYTTNDGDLTGEMSESQVNAFTEQKNKEIREKQSSQENDDQQQDIEQNDQGDHNNSDDEPAPAQQKKSASQPNKQQQKQKNAAPKDDGFFDGGEDDDIDIDDL